MKSRKSWKTVERLPHEKKRTGKRMRTGITDDRRNIDQPNHLALILSYSMELNYIGHKSKYFVCPLVQAGSF